MLYTGKGDDGKTKLFGCDQRFSKSSVVADALGTVDELNSFLGLCKVRARNAKLVIEDRSAYKIIDDVQQNLFIIQAKLAGADKNIKQNEILEMEKLIGIIEKAMPPIHSFFVSGGTELATLFDIARTIARRAERSIVAFYTERDEMGIAYNKEDTEPNIKINEQELAYANRLSSLLYAFARLANHRAGTGEENPRY